MLKCLRTQAGMRTRSELASGQVHARLIGQMKKGNVAQMIKYLTPDYGTF